MIAVPPGWLAIGLIILGLCLLASPKLYGLGMALFVTGLLAACIQVFGVR